MRSALVVLLIALSVAKGDSLLPSRVHLVYVSPTGNMLFRGNEPVDEDQGDFAYELLQATMTELTERSNTTFPESYSLHDISFLNPETLTPDEHDIRIEELEPQSDEDVTFSLMTLLGDSLPPCQVSRSEANVCQQPSQINSKGTIVDLEVMAKGQTR